MVFKMSKFNRTKRENLKQRCLEYLGGKVCKLCRVDYLPLRCYDFHHDKGTKEYDISKMIARGDKFSKIKKELDKCVVSCKNCHAFIHWEEDNNIH